MFRFLKGKWVSEEEYRENLDCIKSAKLENYRLSDEHRSKEIELLNIIEEKERTIQELKQELRDAKSKVGNLCNQLREEESIRRSIQDLLNRQIEKLKEEVAFWSNQCIAKDSEVKG